MITRDKDDPRNKEECEMGPGGLRLVIVGDLLHDDAMQTFRKEMDSPGSRLYGEISGMKMSRAGREMEEED